MKKIALLAMTAVLAAACSTVNKNTLSYKLSKVNGEKFLTAVSSGFEKKADAEADAKRIMKNRLTAAGGENDIIVADLYNHAFIQDTWRDKTNKKYYAIAALERRVGKDMIIKEIHNLDGQINGLASQFETADKFGQVRTGLKIQPVIEQRNSFQDLYALLDFGGQGFEADKYNALKKSIYESLNKVKFSLTVKGANSNILHSHIINGLNEIGLSVAINEAADISVDVTSEINEYPSKIVNGLMWCRSTSTIALKDMSTGGIFSTFTVTDRQGSSRAEEAVIRTMDSVGQSSSVEVQTRLLNYLAKR